jgi:hypothetical protein
MQAFRGGFDRAVENGDGAAAEKFIGAIRNLGREGGIAVRDDGVRSFLKAPGPVVV